MRLRYVILYVADVGRSLDFFERAFGLERRFLHEGGDYGELDTGGTTLSLSALSLIESMGASPARADPGAPTGEIDFETDDVAGAFERAVTAGAEPRRPVTEEPWGQTTATVATPDGHLVAIVSPVAQG